MLRSGEHSQKAIGVTHVASCKRWSCICDNSTSPTFVIVIDDAVATSYGQLAAAVANVGRQPRSRVMDLLIAATAHAHGARLYTRNAADFFGIEHLIDIVSV